MELENLRVVFFGDIMACHSCIVCYKCGKVCPLCGGCSCLQDDSRIFKAPLIQEPINETNDYSDDQ